MLDLNSYSCFLEKCQTIAIVSKSNEELPLGLDQERYIMEQKSTMGEDITGMHRPLTVRVKKLDPNAEIPCIASLSDAGADMVAIDNGEWVYSIDGKELLYIQYKTGIAIETPKGYHTEIFPRSSISKYDIMLANSIGLVDESYRGEIMCRFKPTLNYLAYTLKTYEKGDKIAQLVLRKTYSPIFEEVEELGSSERGSGGFGSTGA